MLRTAQLLMSGKSSSPRKNFPAALTAEESTFVLFPHTSCSTLQFFLYLSKANIQYPKDTCEINPRILWPVYTWWTLLPLVFTITHLFKWLMGNRVKPRPLDMTEPGCFNSLETMSTVFILMVFWFTHFLKHFKGLLIIRILILPKVLGCVLYHQDICWVAD